MQEMKEVIAETPTIQVNSTAFSPTCLKAKQMRTTITQQSQWAYLAGTDVEGQQPDGNETSDTTCES